MNLESICILGRGAGYNDPVKRRFKKAAMKYVRDLAEQLQLPQDTFDIRWNEGGIAVSGEATLHHECFYLQISGTGAYWRTCKGRRDYSGGNNCWLVGFGQAKADSQVVNDIVRALNLVGR